MLNILSEGKVTNDEKLAVKEREKVKDRQRERQIETETETNILRGGDKERKEITRSSQKEIERKRERLDIFFTLIIIIISAKIIYYAHLKWAKTSWTYSN